MAKEKEQVDRGISIEEASMDQIGQMLGTTLSKLSLPLEQHQVLQRGLGRLVEAASPKQEEKEDGSN